MKGAYFSRELTEQEDGISKQPPAVKLRGYWSPNTLSTTGVKYQSPDRFERHMLTKVT